MPQLSQDRVLELFLSFWVARGVMAAVELDLFEVLENDALTAEEVGARLDLQLRPARALLDTCVATGLLVRDGARYTNSPDASAYLCARSELSLRNYVLDERWCWDAWRRLDEALRTNSQTLPPDETTGYHAFPAEFFLDFLHGHSLAMGRVLAGSVDLRDVGRLMDVGGGSGAVSIALCEANPNLHAVVVDQPPVLQKTREHVARAGLAGRISTHAANLFTDALPDGCDAAVIANLLHDFAEDRARAILSRVSAALPQGGRLVIMEMAPNEDRSGPPIPVAFALTMIVNTEGGDSYTVPQYSGWLTDAGFDVARIVDLGGSVVTTAIEAVKR